MRSFAAILILLGLAFVANTSSKPVYAQSPEGQKPETVQTTEQKPVEPKVVVVQKGDTLTKIATAHQTTYIRLFDANEKIKDPDVIYPGDQVRIPEPSEQLASRPIPSNQPAPAPQPKKQATPKAPAKAKAPAPRRTSAPAPAASVASGSVWDRLAACESGGNWSINTGNGYYGGLQFSLATWRGLGAPGYPHQASRETQIAYAEKLLARSGWGQWPACTLKLGLR